MTAAIEGAALEAIRRDIERLSARMAERDLSEFTGKIRAALQSEGFTISAPAVADFLVRQVAATAPENPAAAALEMAKQNPIIFQAKSDPKAKDLQSPEERARELQRLGVVPISRPAGPDRRNYVEDAAAGRNAKTATTEQRSAHLRSIL